MTSPRSFFRLLSSLLLALFLSGRMAAAAPGDPCDNRLHPITGQAGCIWRGDRCEGFYVSPVAAMDLEVVSLLKGKLRFDLRPNGRLDVLTPNVTHVTQGPVRVRAVALTLRTYRRMDAVLPANRPLVWPVDAVLLPWRLEANRSGVFGWIDMEAERLFVPLQVI